MHVVHDNFSEVTAILAVLDQFHITNAATLRKQLALAQECDAITQTDIAKFHRTVRTARDTLQTLIKALGDNQFVFHELADACAIINDRTFACGIPAPADPDEPFADGDDAADTDDNDAISEVFGDDNDGTNLCTIELLDDNGRVGDRVVHRGGRAVLTTSPDGKRPKQRTSRKKA